MATPNDPHNPITISEADEASPRRIRLRDLGLNFDHDDSEKTRTPMTACSEALVDYPHIASDSSGSDEIQMEDQRQRRTAYRLDVSLKAMAVWSEGAENLTEVKSLGVMTNLSGGGAQLFLRRLPETESLTVSLAAPDEFVEEQAARSAFKTGTVRPGTRVVTTRTVVGRSVATRGTASPSQLLRRREQVRTNLRSIKARVVSIKLHATDSRGPIYSISLSFAKPREDFFRLVRFLERKHLQQESSGRLASPASQVAPIASASATGIT